MLDILIVLSYLVVTIYIGFYNSKKISSNNDYVSAGSNKYSASIIFCTLTVTYIGGGFTIGLAEKTFVSGIIYIVAIYGFSIKEMLIAKYIAPKMNYFQDKCFTAGDIMFLSYGKVGQLFTGFASLVICGGIIGAQFATCGNICQFFLGISPIYGILVTALVIIFYVTWGGVKSVVKVNVFHFIILSIMLIILFILGLVKIGGFIKLINSIPNDYLLLSNQGSFVPLLILALSFFLGETLIPPYIQRLLIGKTNDSTVKGTFYSGIASIIIFTLVGIVGMISYILNPKINPHLAFASSISSILPIGLKGLGIAAMFAILMSSADAFLHATSVAVRRDIMKPLGWNISDDLKKELKISRVITCFIGLIAMIFAMSSSSILEILLYAYQFWTPVIIVPLIAAIYRIKTSNIILIISSVLALLSVCYWNIFSNYSSDFVGSLEGVVLGVLVNFVSFILLRKTFLNKNANTVDLKEDNRVFESI